MLNLYQEAQSLFLYSQNIRRDLHQHPELGFQEVRTAGVIARELNTLQVEMTIGVGKTGVVAILEAANPGPVVLLRFDMDALPITEATGAEYASIHPGVMHACGHDGHVAIGLTVARLLHEHRRDWSGTVKLVFQPAEEGLGGAEAMINDGVLANPRPDVVLALHIWNEKPQGWLGICPGPVMAASEIFHIRILGKGGHGALPHTTNDPVLAASQIVNALQGIVARNVPPLESAVLSVTMIHAGDAFNIIPQVAELQGTIRSFDPAVRRRLLERFNQVVSSVSQAFDCQAEIIVKSITPAVVNDPEVTSRIRKVAEDNQLGDNLPLAYSTMGSEDMAFMMQDFPSCYFFVGSNNSAKGLDFAHHHQKFDFDEASLPRAAALMAAAAMDFLKAK
jgi:amidohydrolase